MRIDVKKYLFFGVTEEKERFFERAQTLGIIHFIDKKSVRFREGSDGLQHLILALKVLRGLPTSEQEEMSDYTQADRIANEILALKHQIDKQDEELRILKLEIERVKIFGHFSMKDLHYIEKEGKRKLRFFCAKLGFKDEVELPDDVLYIDSNQGLDYFVAIEKEPIPHQGMVEMKIEHPLGALEHQRLEVTHQSREAHEKLKKYEKYSRFLHQALIDKMNEWNLKTNKEYVEYAIDDQLFSVEGFVPVDKVDLLESLRTEFHLAIEEIAIEEGDFIPTYLENSGYSRIGEDLVHIYDTPSHKDNDPSPWVLVSFAFFFAMIVGDGGYGLIFLATALYFNYKHQKAPKSTKRVIKLFGILGVCCIAWGLMINSFFGIYQSVDSPLRKISLLNWMAEKKAEYVINQKGEEYQALIKQFPKTEGITNPREFLLNAIEPAKEGEAPKYVVIDKYYDNIMLELALFVGSVHIILSMLRYVNRNIPNAGWILFIIGCYMYFPVYLGATSLVHYIFHVDKVSAGIQGQWLIGIGFALAMVLAVIRNRFAGLMEIMNLIQVFADILSYLRIYALGLAGGIVGALINETAAAALPIIGIPLILIGHGINIVLSVIGGVIHGLRLNFIEWYHYSFEGEGKMFKPLTKIVIEKGE